MDAIMKNFFCYFLLSFVMFLGVSPALAEGPWSWDLTLQEVKPGGIMNLPTAIFIDNNAERYYVVDGGKNRIVSYDLQGGFISVFNASNKLKTPFDLVREPGVLWVVEKGKNSLKASR